MDEDVHEKRVIKPTPKAMEENVKKRMGSRKAKLGQLSGKKKEMQELMDDDSNVTTVSEVLLPMYRKLLCEFTGVNDNVKEALCQAGCEDDMSNDQESWFLPKANLYTDYVLTVEQWINAATLRQEEASKANDAVYPEDSVSVTSKKSGKSKSSAASSSATIRAKLEMEKAALAVKVATFKRKQALDVQELKLKTEREEFELHAQLAVNDAQLNVLQQYEGSKVSSKSKRNGVNVPTSTPMKGKVNHADGSVVSDGSQRSSRTSGRNAGSNVAQVAGISMNDSVTDALVTVMQRQNDITECLMKQQKHSTLPPQTIPIFKGDPMEYHSFMKAFEHGVESKTENSKDRLYFMEQHTSGKPRDLVRSCFHMNPDEGYREARRILKERFGDKYKISVAYIDKALSWPSIKADDINALESFALFLTSCSNAMADLDYLDEMESAASMRTIITKLPYRMREKFRSVALDIQQKQDRRPRFKDVVTFINRQAEIASHPVFGELLKDKPKVQLPDKNADKPSGRKSFTTTATEVNTQKSVAAGTSEKKRTQGKTDKAFNKPCIFCQGDHTMEQCKKLQKMLHKEKLEFLKSKGLCFSCLLSGHMSKTCGERLSCQICSATHPTLLHIKQKDKEPPKEEAPAEAPAEKQSFISGFVGMEDTCSQTGAGCTDSILAIVPVQVKAKKGNKVLTCYAFLDPGSNASFCTNKLMNDLNLQGRKVNILLTTMGEQKTISCNAVTDLEVSHLDGDDFMELTEVFTQKDIPVSKGNIPTQEDVDKWPHLRDVQIPSIEADIGLLIGTDVAKALEPHEVIRSVRDGPYAVRTALGWTINGPLRENTRSRTKTGYPQILTNRISVAKLEELWTQQLKYDFPETAQGEQLEMSKEDQLFLDRVSQSTKLENGHYSIGLPLKNTAVKMPNNRALAEQRVINIQKKLKRDQSFRDDYVRFMEDMINKGYAVKVPDEELSRCDGKVWFIPHHGVYHPKKHKIRVVFDCGASYQGTTLNEELLQGPDLTSSLIGVLTRFRQEQVAIMADVEAMFHQVKVPPEDADLLRFLWWPEGDVSQPLQEYRMEVHLFGATSSPSCANYALRRCAADNGHLFDAAVVDTVLHNFYVDDCLRSVASEQDAVKLYHDVKSICQKGGFKLTKWMSNNVGVLENIPQEDRAKEVKDLDLDQDSLPVERVLGVQWCIQSDQFKFRVNIQEKPLTRRGILSMMSSVYDPLGMLATIILPARCILQELCRLRTSWDDAVPEHLAQQWCTWVDELQQLSNFGVDRCFRPPEFGEVVKAQLHHFCDASETGYGTVTYLVQQNKSNEIHCAFVLGKARVAPLKPTTIPRLELTAATLAVKVDLMLKRELQLSLSDSMFWTDSTAVLKYIANENTRFKTFVANRVSTILQASKVQQWNYINTLLNPADYASRGQKVSTLMKNKVWIAGPDFLSKPREEWPEKCDHLECLTAADPEVKKGVVVNAVTAKESTDAVQQLIEYFSSWRRLKKAVAWLSRVRSTLRILSQKRKELNGIHQDQQSVNKEMLTYKKSLKQTYLTVDDMRQAELIVISHCQQKKFPEEITALQKHELVKRSSQIFRLNPVLQDGILRVGGRLSRAAMPAEAKHPAILPKDHRVADLILQDVHERLGHSGRNHILSHLRQRYWIPSAYSLIRKILSRCTTCRRQHGALGKQMMADLPRNRVLPDDPPFTRTGVDLFGPFDVKRGRSSVKRYGVIFTCLACRAVHIEMATSLETDSFINALRRFIARRGQVKEMRSDNGTNLVGADRELRKAMQEWNTAQIENSLLQDDIKWMFNPPTGSHHGGVWERIIRSIRKIMNVTLREQSLADEESLQTFFCECEAILNSRPITTPSNDMNDLEALTPQHLLLLKTNPYLPPGLFQRDDLYSRKRWKQVQYMSDLFWKRWTREYLPELQKRQKWFSPSRNFVSGDVVLIADDSAPRGSWLMGRIVKTVEDENGLVRKVRVKTKTSELERPITKVCLLQEAV